MIWALYSKNKWSYPIVDDFVDAKGNQRTMQWLRSQSKSNLAKVGVFPVEEVRAVPPRGAISADSLLEFVDGKLRVTPQFKIDAEKAKTELLVEADKAHEQRCVKGVKVGNDTFPYLADDIADLLIAREALTSTSLTNLKVDPSCNVFFSNGKVHLLKLSEIKIIFDRLSDAHMQSLHTLADQYEAAGVARFRSVVIEATPASADKQPTEPPVIEPEVKPTPEPVAQPTPQPDPQPQPVVLPPTVPVTPRGPVYEIVDDEAHAFSGYVNQQLKARGATKFFDEYVNVAGNDYARAIGPFASQAEENLIAQARQLLPAGTAYDITVTRYDSV